MGALVVRDGRNARLPPDGPSGTSRHTLVAVYSEMLLQICRDYAGLPDPRTLTLGEIRFFYRPLSKELCEYTAKKHKA